MALDECRRDFEESDLVRLEEVLQYADDIFVSPATEET